MVFRYSVVLPLAAACIFAPARPAAAGMFESVGAGESAARGNIGVADTGGFAAFYNPAALYSERTEIEAGYVYAVPRLSWESGGRGPDHDIPLSQGFNVGVVQNLYCFRMESLNFGFAVHIPTDDFYYWRTWLPPREQFIRYEDDLKHFQFFTGLSWWITDSLSVGAGLSATAKVVTTTSIIYTEEGATINEQFKRAQTASISPKFVPFFGAALHALDTLRWGVRYHPEMYIDDHDGVGGMGGNVIDLNGFYNIDYKFTYPHHFTHYYYPHTITLGSSWDSPFVTVSSELQYAFWSRYVDTANNAVIECSDYDYTTGERTPRWPCYEGEGRNRKDYYYDLIPGEKRDYSGDFSNTIGFAGGVSYEAKNITLSAGYRYDPTPVQRIPEHTGFLDGTSHLVTFGLSSTLPDLGTRGLSMSVLFSYRLFPEQTLTRAGDGAEYAIDGYIWALGGNLQAGF